MHLCLKFKNVYLIDRTKNSSLNHNKKTFSATLRKIYKEPILKTLLFTILALSGYQAFAGTMINQGSTSYVITLTKKSGKIILNYFSAKTYFSHGSIFSTHSANQYKYMNFIDPDYHLVLDLENLSPTISEETSISHYSHWITNFSGIPFEYKGNDQFLDVSEAIDFSVDQVIKEIEQGYISHLNRQDKEHEISDINVNNHIEVKDLKCSSIIRKVTCSFRTKDIFAVTYKSKYNRDNQ